MSRASATRTPTTGMAGCCARAASGHVTAAPPRSVMSSRRLTRSPRRRSYRSPNAGYRIGSNAASKERPANCLRIHTACIDYAGSASKSRLLPAVLGVALFADPLDRDHLLVLGGVEHDDALGRAPGDADAIDRAADQLPAIGDQHELIGLFHRERGDQRADLLLDRLGALLAFPDRHRDQAFAAAIGDAVFVGRRALAVAALRHREDELLGRRHFDIALFAKLNRVRRRLLRLLGVARRLLQLLAVLTSAHGVGALQIGHALLGADV